MVVTYEHRRETCKYMHVNIHLNNFHSYLFYVIVLHLTLS